MNLNSAQAIQSSIIWVLVANGSQAQIYCYHQHEKTMPMQSAKRKPYEAGTSSNALTPLPDMKFAAESLKDFNVGHDDRGSKIGGARPGYNTCEPHLDIHDEVKQNLVKEIVAKLKNAHQAKAFDQLVIVASPETLGALRLHLDKSVQQDIVAEIDKDFTSDKNHALLAHLEKTFVDAHLK